MASPIEHQVGPGNYEINKNSYALNTFNKKVDGGYVGNTSMRFAESIIRPGVGPGSYDVKVDAVK